MSTQEVGAPFNQPDQGRIWFGKDRNRVKYRCRQRYYYAAFLAFMINGTRMTRRMPTTNPTRMRVILRFFHLICFFKSVLLFLNTFACSFSWSLLAASVSAFSVFLSIPAMFSPIWSLTLSTCPRTFCALSTFDGSSYFLQYPPSNALDFFVREPGGAIFASCPNCASKSLYNSCSMVIATRDGYRIPVMTATHTPEGSDP
mmetsp:Transcript_31503/g.44720  ORF Transcript_31503/g.44720 Transcript_31503/m.44720 type:complete len:201 (+) Transcript_31503:1091-1693(+)